MSNELIIELPKQDALQVFVEAKGIDPFIDKIRKEALSHVPDIETKKGREQIASMAMKVAKCKTYLDNAGKELCDQERAKIDATLSAVLASRKRIKQELDDLRDEVRKPLTDWENAEGERKGKIESRIEEMRRLPEVGSNSKAIEKHLKRLQATEIDDSFDEYTAEAAIARTHAIRDCKSRLEAQIKIESDLKELEELRKQKEMQAQKEREEKIAQDAIEKALAEVSKKEEKKPEVKEYKPCPGTDDIDDDVLRTSIINEEMVSDLVFAGTHITLAKTLLRKIIDGKVRHLSINYED